MYKNPTYGGFNTLPMVIVPPPMPFPPSTSHDWSHIISLNGLVIPRCASCAATSPNSRGGARGALTQGQLPVGSSGVGPLSRAFLTFSG